MAVVQSDHGSADFGSRFIELCERFNIIHAGSTPRRSQSNGFAEVANKLLQNQLSRVCSSDLGRKNWDKSLPKAVQTLNCYYPNRSKLSRTQLLFSPYYFCATGGIPSLSNPIKFQQFSYKQLNEHRIKNLLNQKISSKKEKYFLNQFVTKQNNLEQGPNSSKLIIPSNSQLYKIVDIKKEGFQFTLLNVSTGARQDVLHSKIRPLRTSVFQNPNYLII